MRTYYERRYFTLDDVRHDMAMFAGKEGPFVMESQLGQMAEYFSDVIKNCGWTVPSTDWNNSFSTYIDTCWQKYIWPKFYDKHVCYTDDTSIADDDSEKVFANFIGAIIAWMSSSDEKYSLLIKNLEDNKTKLLGTIKSSSEQRFNDTPQNGGDWSADNHTTNYKKNTSETDGGTLLSRLNEVEDNIKELYDDWSDEFRKFIFWSVK